MKYTIIAVILFALPAYAGECDSQADCRTQSMESVRQAQEQQQEAIRIRNEQISQGQGR